MSPRAQVVTGFAERRYSTVRLMVFGTRGTLVNHSSSNTAADSTSAPSAPPCSAGSSGLPTMCGA